MKKLFLVEAFCALCCAELTSKVIYKVTQKIAPSSSFGKRFCQQKTFGNQ